MFKSIRHGLFAALAGFTVFICVCYTALALVIAYVTEDMLIARLLEREAAAIAAHLRLQGEVKPPAGDLIRVYRDAAALPAPVRAQVAAGMRHAEIFTDSGRHYHLRTLDLDSASGPQRLYLLADAAPLLVVSKLIQDVGGVLIFVALGLIAVALLLAWLLARRLVSPLLVLAHEVRSLAPNGEGSFSARGRPDEIGYLADRLGTTLAELHAALAREHAFTRDVSHELRTPLTVMNNILAQASGRPLDLHEVTQLRAGVDDIRKTVEVLFALARAEHAEHIALVRFDLRGAVEDSLLRLLGGDEGEGEGDGERLVLDLPERLDVVGNPHLTTLLLNNCLGNALFHGGPRCRLRLAWADGMLAIDNTIDPGSGETMQGFQHGQNLLRRIAAAMGWELRFEAGETRYRVGILPLRS